MVRKLRVRGFFFWIPSSSRGSCYLSSALRLPWTLLVFLVTRPSISVNYDLRLWRIPGSLHCCTVLNDWAGCRFVCTPDLSKDELNIICTALCFRFNLERNYGFIVDFFSYTPSQNINFPACHLKSPFEVSFNPACFVENPFINEKAYRMFKKCSVLILKSE